MIDNKISYEEWKSKLPENLRNETPDYNLFGAYEAGLEPEYSEDDNSYHLGSRNPETGELLKRPGHPTFDIAVEEDKKLGYELYEENGKYYTLKPEEIQDRISKREKYRRVDSDLFKDIILDTSQKMGWNTNGLNDYEVKKIYNDTGGNVETLYKLLLRKAGGDLSTLTNDVMIKNLDKYGVVDKINTPKTKEYINWDEIAKNIGTLEVDKDMTFSPNAKRILSDDDKRKQEKIIDEIDAIYAQNGELTPIQKEVIANRRLNRSKQEILKSVGATPRGQQLFDEEFKKIASDLNLDISNGRFQVKKSDIDAYGAFNRAAELSQVLGKKENIEDTIFHFYTGAVSSNEDLKREGKYKSEDTGFWSRIYKVNQSVNPTGNMIKEVFSGDLDVTNDEIAQAFNQSTIDLYDKWKESKERSGAGNFATGIWEGMKGSVESNVDMLKGALKARRFMDLRGKMEKIKSTLPNDMNVYEKQQEILSNLTPDERRLLESASNYYGALETINSDLPKSMNIGESIGASLAFMAEFIGTGGTGWLKSAAKAGVKVAAKGIAKSAAKGGLSKIGRGAEKVAERMAREGTPIANKFLNATVNFAKNQAFAVPEAAIQSVIQPSFWNEVGERILTGDDTAKAFGNTLYDRTIENWSERVFVGGGGFGKLTGSALNFEKLKGIRGVINTAKGIGEEYAEELIGDAARRMPWTGKESFSQAYKNYWGEDKWDTFLSVAFITGVLGGAGHVYNKAVKIKYDGAVNITRNAIPEMLADDVDRLLDSGDINSKETLDALAGLIESSSRANNIPFNKLESNVNRYIVAKLNQKGFELSGQSRESGEKEEPENKPQNKMLLNGKEVDKIEILGDGKSKITDIEGNVAYPTEEQVKGYDENGVFVGETGNAQNFTTDKEGNLVRVEKNSNFDENISDNGIRNDNRGVPTEVKGGVGEVGIQREGVEEESGSGIRQESELGNKLGSIAEKSGLANRPIQLSNESQRNLSENTYLKRPKKNGRPSYEPVKLRNASVEEFAEATRVGKQDNPHGASVDLHTPEEYEKMKVRLLSEDGKSGIAVEEDGNIVNLFSTNSSTNGASHALFLAALENGGQKGDNFGRILTDLYTQMGAIPVARVKFNDEFAPDGWNYEQDGRPDIIFWMHNGESASEVAKKIGSYEQVDVGSLPLFDSYNEAVAYRDKLLEDRKKANADEAKTEPKDDLKKRLDSIVSDHIEQEKSKIRDWEEKNTERELDEIRWNISRKGIIVNVDGKRVRVSKTRKGGYNTKNQKAIDAFETELDKQIEQEKPRVQNAMEERIKGYDSAIDKEVESYRRKLEEGNITPASPMNAKSQTGGVSISQANEIKKKIKEAYNKGKGEITDKINSVRTALHAYNRLGQLSDKQYKDILKKLSRKNADIEGILDNIDNMIIDNAFKERAYAVKMKQQKQADVIRKKVSKMMLPEWTNHDIIEEFITLDTDNMNAPMLGQYESVMNNLAKPRPKFSRFITDFIAKYHEENVQDSTTKKSNIESNLEKLQERINRLNSRFAEDKESSFQINEYRNVSREVSRLKNMAARWYENELGKIDEGSENYEERVNAVNNSYQSLLNDIESTQEHLKDAGDNLKKGIIEGIFDKEGNGMLMEAMEADGLKDTPFEEKLKEIKRFGVDLKGFDNLELKDLINLEIALFNASIGVPTQDIFTISSKLRANEMQKRLQKSREKIERASLNPRVSKLLDDIEKLKDLIDIHDFSMVDAIFDAGSGKDLYEDFFVPQIESAVVRMDKEKALTLKDFGDEMQKLENFFVLSKLTNGTALQKIAGGRSQRYRDLAGMIMTQLDYESNVSVPFEELPDEKKDYFGYVINKTNAPKDLKNRTKDAHQFMRFDKDGKLDVEKTLSNLGNKELSGILRGIIDVARKTLDGKMRQYYIANAVRRGVNMKMMNNYFPRFVKKSLAAKTDGEIDFQNIYSSGKLMPTTLPSSLNKRMAKATPNPVEIDIARVMKRATDETLTDYFLAPAFAQANSALIQAEKQGGKAANAFAVLREATKDRLIKNYRKEISKDDVKFLKDMDRLVAKTARTLLLAKVPKTIAEFASNQIGSLISDGTAGWGYWGKIDVLHELADVMDLTSSKNIMKYNEIFRDASGKKMSWGEKGVTNLITINDTWTSSAIYYKTFNKLFEQYSGQKFDYQRARTDDEYRKWVIEDHNGERSYFERAHIGALTRAQESFTTVNRALGATHTKFLFGKGKMDVDSWGARTFGFMMSFNTNEHFELVRGLRELGTGIWSKDGKLIRDGIGRIASRFIRGYVYSASFQQIGNFIASGLRDDKEPEWVLINPNLLAGTCVNLALGRYGNTGGIVLNLGLGLLNYLDKKTNGNTKLTKSVVRAINDGAGIYAKPMSTGIPTLKSIEKVLPYWGFMMNIFLDSSDMVYDIYRKMDSGKSLTDDEQMLWGNIAMMNAILTMLYPNPITTTGFNVSRTVESSYKRDKYDKKENSKSVTSKTSMNWAPLK